LAKTCGGRRRGGLRSAAIGAEGGDPCGTAKAGKDAREKI